MAPKSDHAEVAVVGGGVSGLYSAWRLLKAGEHDRRPITVTVYERSDRVGGRLLTWMPKGNAGGLRAELGGMRFLEQQELVCKLLPVLGFGRNDIVPFYVKGKNLRLLLRGSSGALGDHGRTDRYLLPPYQRGKEASELIEEVIRQVVMAPENVSYLTRGFPQTREQWDELKPHLTWNSRPLWDIGFWDLLAELRTAETYQYMIDAFGYYSLASNWNAAEAMQFISLDFTTNPAEGRPEYLTLRQGYEALPEALEKEVERLGGKIRKETRLVSFEASRKGVIEAVFDGPDGTELVRAKSLVLALPRRSLEMLTPSRDFDLQDDALRRLIESVVPVPAFKFFLFFRERWWERMFGITKGRSVSDLPLRQTYYMGPDSLYEEDPMQQPPPWGLVMASYGDARAVDFWQGMVPPDSRNRKRERRKLHDEMVDLVDTVGLEGGPKVSEPPPELHRATPQMIEHAMKQLALLHDVSVEELPKPDVGAFADWGFDPYGGGWNFWQPQVNVRDTMKAVKTPLGKGRGVYIVGESYSGAPGWVEGALTTAELVLQEHFGLRAPEWLPKDYYLGW